MHYSLQKHNKTTKRKITNTNTKMKENKKPKKEGDKPIGEIINMM
jgi:hypothetical protein